MPADLLGPYDGRVTDAETGQPVTDAIVVGIWSFTRGVGLRGPAGSVETAARTDAAGKYRIAQLEELPAGLSTAVSTFTRLWAKS